MADYNSNPILRTKAGAEFFLRCFHSKSQGNEPPHSCYLGHHDCSTHDNGPCLDETLSNFPELKDYT